MQLLSLPLFGTKWLKTKIVTPTTKIKYNAMKIEKINFALNHLNNKKLSNSGCWSSSSVWRLCRSVKISSITPICLLLSFAFSPPLKLSFGKLARFADGSCVASLGSTSVLVTAVCRQNAPSSSQGTLNIESIFHSPNFLLCLKSLLDSRFI